MLFVHFYVFLFAYCTVVMAGYFDVIKVCCKAIVTCVKPEVSDCLSSRFVFVMFPCRFNVVPLSLSR